MKAVILSAMSVGLGIVQASNHTSTSNSTGETSFDTRHHAGPYGNATAAVLGSGGGQAVTVTMTNIQMSTVHDTVTHTEKEQVTRQLTETTTQVQTTEVVLATTQTVTTSISVACSAGTAPFANFSTTEISNIDSAGNSRLTTSATASTVSDEVAGLGNSLQTMDLPVAPSMAVDSEGGSLSSGDCACSCLCPQLPLDALDSPQVLDTAVAAGDVSMGMPLMMMETPVSPGLPQETSSTAMLGFEYGMPSVVGGDQGPTSGVSSLAMENEVIVSTELSGNVQRISDSIAVPLSTLVDQFASNSTSTQDTVMVSSTSSATTKAIQETSTLSSVNSNLVSSTPTITSSLQLSQSDISLTPTSSTTESLFSSAEALAQTDGIGESVSASGTLVVSEASDAVPSAAPSMSISINSANLQSALYFKLGARDANPTAI